VEISPDQVVYWTRGFVVVNATLVFSWTVMAILTVAAWRVSRRLSADPRPGRFQNLMEALVDAIRRQIRDAVQEEEAADRYLPFVATLFLFIVTCNVLLVVPGFQPPTASLSTTAALALCVFVAVPLFGVAERGLAGYLRRYVQPTPLMLPFQVIGELSRTLALAVRLFGNVASGTLIVAILLSVAPFFFPVLMNLLGLLIGVIQAYVFAVLALIYIASGARAQRGREPEAVAGAGAAGREE
jgi:F-type H+-transporting ATPase subunit a